MIQVSGDGGDYRTCWRSVRRGADGKPVLPAAGQRPRELFVPPGGVDAIVASHEEVHMPGAARNGGDYRTRGRGVSRVTDATPVLPFANQRPREILVPPCSVDPIAAHHEEVHMAGITRNGGHHRPCGGIRKVADAKPVLPSTIPADAVDPPKNVDRKDFNVVCVAYHHTHCVARLKLNQWSRDLKPGVPGRTRRRDSDALVIAYRQTHVRDSGNSGGLAPVVGTARRRNRRPVDAAIAGENDAPAGFEHADAINGAHSGRQGNRAPTQQRQNRGGIALIERISSTPQVMAGSGVNVLRSERTKREADNVRIILVVN